jgi:hypothetical protein
MPLYPAATVADVEATLEEDILDGYVMNEEISIIFVVVEKRVDADEIGEIEETDGGDEDVDVETDVAEGDVEVVMPGGVGDVEDVGSVPFFFGPLTGVPKGAAAVLATG